MTNVAARSFPRTERPASKPSSGPRLCAASKNPTCRRPNCLAPPAHGLPPRRQGSSRSPEFAQCAEQRFTAKRSRAFTVPIRVLRPPQRITPAIFIRYAVSRRSLTLFGCPFAGSWLVTLATRIRDGGPHASCETAPTGGAQGAEHRMRRTYPSLPENSLMASTSEATSAAWSRPSRGTNGGGERPGGKTPAAKKPSRSAACSGVPWPDPKPGEPSRADRRRQVVTNGARPTIGPLRSGLRATARRWASLHRGPGRSIDRCVVILPSP